MGYSISLAISVNKLTSDRIQIVLVMIFGRGFEGSGKFVDLPECSNLLVHCRSIFSAVALRMHRS